MILWLSVTLRRSLFLLLLKRWPIYSVRVADLVGHLAYFAPAGWPISSGQVAYFAPERWPTLRRNSGRFTPDYALMERKKEIGVMQAVGWTQRNIETQIVSEVFLAAISGCIIGVAISDLVIKMMGSINIQTEISQSLSNTLTTLSAPLMVPVVNIVESSLLALIITLAVSLILVKRMTGMKPMTNLRNS